MNPGCGVDLGGEVSIMQDSHSFIYGQLAIFYFSNIIPSATRRMSYVILLLLDGPNKYSIVIQIQWL